MNVAKVYEDVMKMLSVHSLRTESHPLSISGFPDACWYSSLSVMFYESHAHAHAGVLANTSLQLDSTERSVYTWVCTFETQEEVSYEQGKAAVGQGGAGTETGSKWRFCILTNPPQCKSLCHHGARQRTQLPDVRKDRPLSVNNKASIWTHS